MVAAAVVGEEAAEAGRVNVIGRITPPEDKPGVVWLAPLVRAGGGVGAAIVIREGPGTDTGKLPGRPAGIVGIGVSATNPIALVGMTVGAAVPLAGCGGVGRDIGVGVGVKADTVPMRGGLGMGEECGIGASGGATMAPVKVETGHKASRGATMGRSARRTRRGDRMGWTSYRVPIEKTIREMGTNCGADSTRLSPLGVTAPIDGVKLARGMEGVKEPAARFPNIAPLRSFDSGRPAGKGGQAPLVPRLSQSPFSSSIRCLG